MNCPLQNHLEIFFIVKISAKACQSFNLLISESYHENPSLAGIGSGCLQCKQDVCYVMYVEQEKDGSGWEQSASTYPLLFHIMAIQMFLISSAWATEEIWDILRGMSSAVTDANQRHGYASVCSVALKCPANFNSKIWPQKQSNQHGPNRLLYSIFRQFLQHLWLSFLLRLSSEMCLPELL